VLNKIDLFQGEDELAQVRDFILQNARNLFGIAPEIFPVSARLAQRAKLGEPEQWSPSRFEAVENYIQDTLDETGRVRLKLLNPLGVGLHLADQYGGVIASRLDLLKTDLDTLQDVEAQLQVYREDMQRDFTYRMSDIENVLFEMEQRGQDFFDSTMRLVRIFDLLDKRRIQAEFEQVVVADAPTRIETKVNELIDWLVESDLRQWQAVMEHLAERRRQHQERIVGDAAGGTFHFDRERLIDEVGRETRRVVETYNKTGEAEAIAEGARTSVAALAAVEIGAVGLGTIIAILATTAAADITGVLLASLVAALGLFIIPARRRQAKAEMRAKIATLRQQLSDSLRGQFEKEMERSQRRIQEAIAPYSRFVRAEQVKFLEVQGEMESVKNGLNRLKSQVEEL
jgi:hypothetical protein